MLYDKNVIIRLDNYIFFGIINMTKMSYLVLTTANGVLFKQGGLIRVARKE